MAVQIKTMFAFVEDNGNIHVVSKEVVDKAIDTMNDYHPTGMGKIPAIKEVRTATGFSLLDAKLVVDTIADALKEGVLA